MAHMGVEEQALIPGLPDDIALDCLARVPHCFHPALRPVCRQWSDLVTSPFFRRRRRMIGAAEDLIFMVQALVPREEDRGGADDDARADPQIKDGDQQTKSTAPPVYSLTLYNATLGTWHRAAAAAAAPIPMFAQCAAVGDKLVLVGGWDPATLDPIPTVRVLDPATGSWREGAPMAAARSFFACAAAGGRVYVAGGHDGQKNALRSAEAYDVEADEWAALPQMAEERDECQGVVDGKGRFWAVSGYGTDSQGWFDASAEVFDPVTGEWSKEEGLLGEGGAAALSAAFFAAEGGEGVGCVELGGGRTEVREYEGRGRGWRVVAPAAEGLKSSPRAATVGGGAGERVFVVGSDGEGGNGAWMLEVGRRRWTRVDTPPGFSGFVYSAAALRL